MNVYTVIDAVCRAAEGPCLMYQAPDNGEMVIQPMVWTEGTVSIDRGTSVRRTVQLTTEKS